MPMVEFINLAQILCYSAIFWNFLPKNGNEFVILPKNGNLCGLF